MHIISHIDGSHAFWYVHNNEECIYQGIMYPAWAIDTRNIKSMMVYDEAVPITHVKELTPLLQSIKRHRTAVIDPIYSLYESDMFIDGRKKMENHRVIDILMKDEHEILSRKELRNIGSRITTLSGYSHPVQFYSPQYPDWSIEGQPKDYRRTLYWNPNVITDSLGYAEVEFYNNSYSTHFNVSGAGITASGTPYVLDQDF